MARNRAAMGLGLGAAADVYDKESRLAGGEAWLAASDHAFDGAGEQGTGGRADPDGLRQRVASADAFVHLQDLAETDLLLAADYAAHEAGFAAAQAVTGGKAALYHLDSRNPQNPVARPLTEEIARVVHARAAHPGWIAGMMRHGFRGGQNWRQPSIILAPSRIFQAAFRRNCSISITTQHWARATSAPFWNAKIPPRSPRWKRALPRS